MRILAALAIATMLAGCATTGADEEMPPATGRINEFFSAWAANPDPGSIPTAIRLVDDTAKAMGEDVSNASSMMPIIAFFAHVFHSNPSMAAEWCAVAEKLKSDAAKEALALAFYLADAPECTAAFKTLRGKVRGRSGSSPLVTAPEVPPPPRLDTIIDGEISAPEQLDYCWGAYLATGDVGYALRVFEVAIMPSGEMIDGRPALDTTELTAKLSLLSFMHSDAAVREVVNERLGIVPVEMLAAFCDGMGEDQIAALLDPRLVEKMKEAKDGSGD